MFWVLQLTMGIQEYFQGGGSDVWEPVIWDVPSLLVTTTVAILGFRQIPRLDGLLSRPGRWFALAFGSAPLVAGIAVGLISLLRHAMYRVLGVHCPHDLAAFTFINELLYVSTFYLLFLAVLFGMRSFMAMGRARLAAARSEALAQKAQLLQLTQQLQPHFLFNALTTIVEAIHHEPALAERLLLELARLLRAATDLSAKPESLLDDEVRLLESYALIMQQRFADRASVRFEIDPTARRCRVPTMVLQPLLENAFRHGVERTSARCAVVVAARRAGDRLELEVQDDAGKLVHAVRYGVGLTNLQQRLRARYGTRAGMSLRAHRERGVVARIEMPCEW